MARPVISADDVRAAHRRREHRLAIPQNAIVTPLAREEAGRWGIELVEEGAPRGAGGRAESPGRAATPSGGRAASTPRHVATCDPDELERVIERVRRQVPDADPAVVREIAERVLERLGGS